MVVHKGKEEAGAHRGVLKEDIAGLASPGSPIWLPMASEDWSGWPMDDSSEGKSPLGLMSGWGWAAQLFQDLGKLTGIT